MDKSHVIIPSLLKNTKEIDVGLITGYMAPKLLKNVVYNKSILSRAPVVITQKPPFMHPKPLLVTSPFTPVFWERMFVL